MHSPARLPSDSEAQPKRSCSRDTNILQIRSLDLQGFFMMFPVLALLRVRAPVYLSRPTSAEEAGSR